MQPEALASVVALAMKAQLAPVLSQLVELKTENADLRAHLTLMRSQLEAVEQRASIPGPPGPAGTDGRDGVDGKDGRDGRDGKPFEDCIKGVYVSGKTYEKGDIVTADGSGWVCTTETTTDRPGNGQTGWLLFIKRGRDGKDMR